jgi:hypothetical protein
MWIRKELTHYCELLNLQGYELWGVLPDDGDSIMSIMTKYPYKTYRILYHREAVELFEKKEYDKLKSTIVHELVHIMLMEFAYKSEERFTSRRELVQAEEEAVDHISIVLRKFM